MSLRVVPCTQKRAKAFVEAVHRHHRAPVGAVFCLAAADAEKVCGVAMIGRPVSRILDDGLTLEVNRVATDGTRNACSALYGAARRVAKEMGYARLITYTLPEEGGASLRGAGWVCDGNAGGGRWVHSGSVRSNDWPTSSKSRWSVELNPRAVVKWPSVAEDGDTGQTRLFDEAIPCD